MLFLVVIVVFFFSVFTPNVSMLNKISHRVASFKSKQVNGKYYGMPDFKAVKDFITACTSNHCPFAKNGRQD